MILALQTTTFSAFGGIPAYNRLVCRVLDEIGENVSNHVLVATDRAVDVVEASAKFSNLNLRSFDGNRAAFITTVFRLALSKKLDLVLVGHVNYAPLGLLLKRLQPQMRFGVMLYGIEAWQPLSRLRAHALRRADFMISISEYTRQRAIEANGLDAARICLLPNALEWEEEAVAKSKEQRAKGDDSQLSKESEHCVSGNRINLLSVCRLDQYEQYKGVDQVIEALPEVLKRVPQVQYTVIGSGTDLDRHKELAESVGVADRVHFAGTVDDETLRAAYGDCDLFVLPSAGEGFGFVFLEAMKYGKAIVAANSGGAPEVVQDGVTGKLVEYGNKQQLAETIVDLCLDPSLRHRLGEAGYRRLLEKFTFPHFKRTLTEILQRELPPRIAANISLAPTRQTAGEMQTARD